MHWALIWAGGEGVTAETGLRTFFWKVRYLILSGKRHKPYGADHSHPQYPGPADQDPHPSSPFAPIRPRRARKQSLTLRSVGRWRKK